MIKIALDTSCLNARKKDAVLNILEEMKNEGKVILITSTVLEKEQLDSNKNSFYRNEYLKTINQENKLLEVGRIGISRFGQAVYGDKDKCTALEKLFPNRKDFYDLWILQTVLGKCDYFLTKNSKDFIRKGKKEQIERLGIKIREPNDDFLKEIKKQVLMG